ncbi:hypothetical protein ACJ41O_014769 [Fusarium nematophilum]
MSDSKESIIIVGAGIVGSALARFLASSPTRRNITIIDRSFTSHLGSSGIAPGFVGQYNESEVLTRLAIESVAEYTKIPGGFQNVGGLEVAYQNPGIERLKSRCAKATQLGLPAELLSVEQAHKLAPELVPNSGEGTAVFFSTDGTANAPKITSFYQEEAKKAGVQLVQGDVKKLVIPEGRITGVEILEGDSTRQLHADKVILTTGIWAQELCRELDLPIPVIPVGHPYMHAQPREPVSRELPFVRWPEHHVYARDHGQNYGIGTYNHEPIGCRPTDTATGTWMGDFEDPLKFALGLLPEGTAEEFKGGRSFNGIFSMTPDNMPLAGSVKSTPGLHMAVAVWVTQAAATAKYLVKIIEGKEVDRETEEALDPERFRGQDFAALEEKSLRGYNSIYKTVAKQ